MVTGYDPTAALGRRGERPCFFPARLPWEVLREYVSIPGVARAPGGLRCTWDIAPTVARLLGVAPPVPPLEANVDLAADARAMPGLSRYRALGLQDRLRPYQRYGALFLARRTWALQSDPMRCLASDSWVRRRRSPAAGDHERVALACVQVGDTLLSARGGLYAWNTVTAVHHVGPKPGFRVRLESGFIRRPRVSELVCSEDHQFSVESGARYVPLHRLRIGDAVDAESEWHHGTFTGQRILSIEPVGEVEMMDLTMKDPLNNYVAGGFVVHNSGKSVQSLAASVLVDAEHVLIVCPALAKYVWADEIAKWLGEEALILEGRGGRVARRYCIACGARGYTETDPLGAPIPCSACRLRNGQSRGYKLFDVRRLSAKDDVAVVDGQIVRTIAFRCPKHPDLATTDSAYDGAECQACKDELATTIRAARFVLVNYDLLTAQKSSDERGVTFIRGDLQGWAPTLAQFKFDLCIADEAHQLRGWSSDAKKKGQTRRERFAEVAANIPRVWGLTGTPVYGFTRDLWGQLDAISGGLFSDTRGLPFAFHSRYCLGFKDTYGWKADGRSPLADTELVERLEYIKIQRSRSEILKDMPAKIRQVIRVDEDAKAKKAAAARAKAGANEGRLMRLLKQTSAHKRDAVVENVVAELAAGSKCVVFTLLRESADKMSKALEKAIQSKDVATRMREVRANIWTTHGDASPQVRFELARSFREHDGAGVFIATIDSVQVAVSLKGATSVHFADLHWQPSAMLQAEDRPYEVGTTGLTIVYYVVRGSVDEHIEAVVLPKIETLARLVAEEGASAMKGAFAGPEESADAIYARMTAHLAAQPEETEDVREASWDEDY
jgi:SNF2 family DNA or RNA helicase